MRRPVVNKDIVDYMRTHLQENKGHLAELEAFARKENIPIIQHEVVAYFRFLLQTLQPKKILEVGTAIGFSALLMAEYAPDAQITTVDRNEEMISFAKENLAKYDSRKQITLVEGDAAEVLQDLDTDYDFVFMDSAKSKYIVFLPEILKRLKVGGVIVFDDIFQGGDIAKINLLIGDISPNPLPGLPIDATAAAHSASSVSDAKVKCEDSLTGTYSYVFL